MKRLLFVLALVCSSANAQVPVALSPTPRIQFFSEQTPSLPLAGGKVCTFNAGTTTPAATYVDIGGIIQNTNPIILDGSGFATIYLANQEYKFIVYDSSGNNACPNSGVQQWSQDNVSAFQPVVGTQTIIFAGVTSDPTGQAGMVDYRTDLGRLRFFNSAWDSVPGLATTDTFSNKTIDITTNTLTNDASNLAGHYIRNNGSKYADSVLNTSDAVTTYQSSGAIAPVLNELVKFTGSTVTVAQTTDTGSLVGLCVANCSIGATNTQVQSSGLGNCIFDGATTNGDYVQNSTTVTGNCHDAGATYPASGQIVGRVTSTNAAGGTFQMIVFPPEIKPPVIAVSVSTLNKQDTQGSATTGNGSAQVVYTYTMPGGSLATGKCLDITFYLAKQTGTNAITPGLTFGATTLSSGAPSSTGNSSWEVSAKVCNNIGTTTAQWAGTHILGVTQVSAVTTAPAENTAGSIVITATATVASPDTWKGLGFTVITDP